jgi:hypothetical protein
VMNQLACVPSLRSMKSTRSAMEELQEGVRMTRMEGRHRRDWRIVSLGLLLGYGVNDILCPLGLWATWCFGVYIEPSLVALVESGDIRQNSDRRGQEMALTV